MFDFFVTIFSKVVDTVISVAITIGLVATSTPTVSVLTATSTKSIIEEDATISSTDITLEKKENTKKDAKVAVTAPKTPVLEVRIEPRVDILQSTPTTNDSREQGLEDLGKEKAQLELEKTKLEVEAARARAEVERLRYEEEVRKATEAQQKITEEERKHLEAERVKLDALKQQQTEPFYLSIKTDKSTIEVGIESATLTLDFGYKTREWGDITVIMTTPDPSQNKTWTLSGRAGAQLTAQYKPKSVGIHTIQVNALDKTSSIDISATPFVDDPPTLSMRTISGIPSLIQPPQKKAEIANILCRYTTAEKTEHTVDLTSLKYDIISNDFNKEDLSLKIYGANNPDCASITLEPLPIKGGKFKLKITGLKFYALGTAYEALGLPLVTPEYEVRDPNVITLWKDSSPKELWGHEGQMITVRSPIMYIGGHSNANLQFNWVGPENNTGSRFSYLYTPCDSFDGCLREEAPIYINSKGTQDGGVLAGDSFVIPFKDGYNYAKINISVPPGGILNASLLLK